MRWYSIVIIRVWTCRKSTITNWYRHFWIGCFRLRNTNKVPRSVCCHCQTNLITICGNINQPKRTNLDRCFSINPWVNRYLLVYIMIRATEQFFWNRWTVIVIIRYCNWNVTCLSCGISKIDRFSYWRFIRYCTFIKITWICFVLEC